MLCLLAVLCCWSGGPVESAAQSDRYTFAVRGVALDEALEAFSQATGAAVAYDPHLVQAHQAFCVADEAAPASILRCLLKESSLDFYRLSSGTYVLTAPAELAPRPGYLTGVVADRDTHAPIADAHVQLADDALGTVTDRAGRFTFPPLLPGRYVLRVSHVGYDTWQDTLHVAAQEETHAEAVLASEPIPVTPVVIDGIQRRQRATETTGRARIDADDPPVGLAASPQGIFRRLNTLPGVRLNDLTADVHVQGGKAGDHQVRLDGVPVYLPRTTLGLIGPFSSFAIDRIAVEKAGFDATHGSQMAGIVRARHALAPERRADLQVDPLSLNGQLQLAPSLAGTEEVAVMTAARVGLWDVHAPRRLRTTLADWSVLDAFLLDAPVPERSLARAQDTAPEAATPAMHFSDLHAAARVRLSPLRTLHASAYHGRRRLTGHTGAFSDAFTEQAADRAPVTVDDDYRWNNLLGQVRYDAMLGSRTLFRAQLRASRYRLRHHYTTLDSLRVAPDATASPIGGAFLPLRDGNALRSAAFETSIDHAWNAHHLQGGLALHRTESAFTLHGIHLADDASYAAEEVMTTSRFSTSQPLPPVRHTATGWRLGAFASDRITLTDRLTAQLGTRLTYLPDRATVYAEPRLALRYDREDGPLGAWSMRTATGLYRQFIHQADASVFNAGALLPSVRVWLPLDASVAIPRAYHLTHEMLFTPAARWRLRLEGYAKAHPHRLTMRYAPAGTPRLEGPIEAQQQFLVRARGYTYGGSVSARWAHSNVRLHAFYEYSRAMRRSPSLFDGRLHPAPWSRPHRVELGMDWMPTSTLTLSLRGHGAAKQPWGFRRIYYDYFGHDDATRWQAPFDLGRPADHVLPMRYQLDVSLSYTRSLGPADLQARLEVLNVTDRANVADWRLARREEAWHRAPRYRYPRLPAAALRLHF